MNNRPMGPDGTGGRRGVKHAAARPKSLGEARAYQLRILPHVSRTFALTIPQLPPPLDEAITNAYLLCRIADTIEDEPGLTPERKTALQEGLVAVLRDELEPEPFAREAAAAVSPETPARERELLRETGQVVTVTRSMSADHRRIVARCLTIMCAGMTHYQRQQSGGGLADLAEVDRYCYYVAGIVGEMLTELFALHCPDIRRHREELLALAPSFGEGLQLTNILKDQWDDRARGACWLPRDVFARHGVALEEARPGNTSAGFQEALRFMIGVTHGHLRNAFSYTLKIPAHQTGIRRFCLWALGLAVLTLRRIDRNPAFRNGQEVKVPRPALRTTIAVTNAAARSDLALKGLFGTATLGLPPPPVALNPSAVSLWHQEATPQPATPEARRRSRMEQETLSARMR